MDSTRTAAAADRESFPRWSRGVPEAVYQDCCLQYGTKCTRFVKLYPGTYTEPLRCDLSLQSLDSTQVRYTALSYVWGDATVLQPIYVDGRLFGITFNLHTALMYLRDPVKSRYMWIDAICINQNDVREKNHQIAQMRQIYGGAEEVVAWLGEAADQSDEAIDYILSETWEDSNAGTPSPETAAALESLFARPYWTRVWVVQELAVASLRSFHCGLKSMSIENLARYLSRQRTLSVETEGSTYSIARHMLRLMMQTEGDAYGYLLYSAQLEATRPLDKIYALLGLFPESFRQLLEPDYNKTFQSLMLDVVRACLATYGDLDILTKFGPLHRVNNLRSINCPTWIPTVTKRSVGLGEHYNTPGSRRPGEFCHSETTLEAKGFAISRITTVHGPFETGFEKLTARFQAKSGLDTSKVSFGKTLNISLEYLKRMYPDFSTQELETKFFLMAAGDRIYSHHAQTSSLSYVHIWLAIVLAERHSYQGHFPDIARQFNYIFARLDGRCFFTTTRGHIGVGSDDISEGDLVCVLYGCRLPVVVREVSAGGDAPRYTFHGAAYLEGIMRGETDFKYDSDCGMNAEAAFYIV